MSKRGWRKMTDEDINFLTDNYLFLSDKKLGELLGRSEQTIRKHRQLLGLKRRGLKVKDVLDDTPIIVWLPRNLFGNLEIDLENLKIGEKNDRSN